MRPLTDPTVRTPLGGAVDLVPFLRRDEGDKTAPIREEERRRAVYAFAAWGWSADRVADATGVRADEVREIWAEHNLRPEPAPAPEPAAVAERPSTRLYGFTSTKSRKGPLVSIPRNVQDNIDALNSRLDRQAEEIQRLKSLVAERTGERDRARACAVAAEQQLAQVDVEIREVERHYEAEATRSASAADALGLAAVQDVRTSIESVTETVQADSAADFLAGLVAEELASKEGSR